MRFTAVLAATLTMSAAFAATPAAASLDGCVAATDARALYGDRIAFEVRRGGSKVGTHETRFDQEGDVLKVTSEMKLKVKVLFIPVYKFKYQSEERWCGDQMFSIDASVNDNGDKNAFSARLEADRLVIEDETSVEAVKPGVLPTNHWNPAVLDDTAVLNTLTGNLNSVDILNRGEEVIETKTGEIRATRYEYQGELETEAWYDEAGRWVKLRFKAEDGSTIEYVCTTCDAAEQSS